MNAGQRMARIAAGAALENLIRAAEPRASASNSSPARAGLARVRLVGEPTEPAGRPASTPRVTNRRPYDGRPVDAAVLDRLAAASPPPGRGDDALDRRPRSGSRRSPA